MKLTVNEIHILNRLSEYGQGLVLKWVNEGATFNDALNLFTDWEQGERDEYNNQLAEGDKSDEE